jgi:hypothetical protein
VVEGQTEEAFVNEILAPELGSHRVFIDTHSITTGRKRGRVFRGGWDSYRKLLRDLVLWMKQDQNPDACFTTMIDLYRLPTDFPGFEECRSIADAVRRVETFEGHLARHLAETLPDHRVAERFVPYIQLHEFEALLFSDPSKFLEAFPDQNIAVARLVTIRAQCGGNPEDIDDGELTAPSKRILSLFPDFAKTVSGVLIAKRIGLSVLRRECRHFDRWVGRLTNLVTP